MINPNISDIKEAMLERKKYLQQLQKQVNRRLQKAPEGTLRICMSHGRTQYYYRKHSSDRAGKYLSDKRLVSRLAQKDYDQKLKKSILAELSAISTYLDTVPQIESEKVLDSMSERRTILLNTVIETDEMFTEKWKQVNYTGKEFPDDFPEYYTERGERVRSKSEVLIANALAHENIPYRYEYPLYLNGLGIVYPDFTILCARHRKEILWEHFGMMDDPEYANKAVKKHMYYTLNGFVENASLILTAETKNCPLNMREVRRLIDMLLL